MDNRVKEAKAIVETSRRTIGDILARRGADDELVGGSISAVWVGCHVSNASVYLSPAFLHHGKTTSHSAAEGGGGGSESKEEEQYVALSLHLPQVMSLSIGVVVLFLDPSIPPSLHPFLLIHVQC